jgi:hypothetical protein
VTADPALADGNHTFAVRFGTSGLPVQVVFIVDTIPPTVLASPAGGTYTAGQKVTLGTSEPSSTYYTIDGSAPTTGSAKYTEPLVLKKSMTLRYIAIDSAGNTSEIGSQTYTVQAAKAGSAHDFDGDGHPDVLARDGAGLLWLYPGDGSGGWLGRSQVGSGWNSMSAIL